MPIVIFVYETFRTREKVFLSVLARIWDGINNWSLKHIFKKVFNSFYVLELYGFYSISVIKSINLKKINNELILNYKFDIKK